MLRICQVRSVANTSSACSRLVARALSSTANSDLKVDLYQYQICPFCSKAKTFFAYTNTAYNGIEVNPLTKAELKWSKDYKKVPIASIDGRVYNGSDEIIQGALEHDSVVKRLKSKWNDKMDMEDFTGKESKRWQDFCNEQLAPLLYPNMCRTWSDSYTAFGYINNHPQFSWLQKVSIRYLGSLAMYLAASRVKKRRGITDERRALEEALRTIELDGLLNGQRQFLSDKMEPNLGDLAVYGTLRCIEGLPAHQLAVVERGGYLKDWYDRMKRKVEE